MAVNTSRRGGCIPVGACAFGAEGRMASIGPSSLGAKGCVAVAQGAKAVVGVLKIIKDASYNKTREPPWRAMEMRHPLWWLGPPPLPKGTGFSGRLGSPTNPVRWSDSSSFATPAELGALWTLASVPHDSVEERRAVYSVPRMGWQGNTSHTSEHILKERSDAQNIVSR